jgi:hypothetical protein
VKVENNSILAFDEFDRQCANHFLARNVSLKGKTESLKMLEQAQRYEDATVLRVIAEGWNVLAEAQGALAHTCIVMLTVKSAKLSFLFDCQKNLAQSLQQKFEEAWISIQNFPLHEAKAAIRDLRMRLKGYLLSVQTEIISDQKGYISSIGKNTKGLKASPSSSSSSSFSSGPTSFDRLRQSNTIITHQDLTPFLQQYITKYQQQSNSNNNGSDTSAGLLDTCTSSDNIIIRTIGNSIFGDAFGSSWKVYSLSSTLPPPLNSYRSLSSDKDNSKACNGDHEYYSTGLKKVTFMPPSLSSTLSNYPQEQSIGQVETDGEQQLQHHHHHHPQEEGEREGEHAENEEESFLLSREDNSSKRVRK